MTAEALAHLSKDEKLAAIFPLITLPDVDAHNDIYLDLLDAIVSQQLSVKAAGTIFNRFIETLDGDTTPQKILDTDDLILRGCGLSFQKAGYIKNIARYWLDNQALTRDWLALTDDEIVSELTQIKGVGKWTVQMILMFRLNRPDVFPVDDLGIQQGMVKIYGLSETGKPLLKKMTDVADAWRPFRTFACRYIWRFKDLKLVDSF